MKISLNMPGRHNVLNALAAIAIATDEGVSDEAIVNGLAKFAGVGRRFQIQGEMRTTRAKSCSWMTMGIIPEKWSL